MTLKTRDHSIDVLRGIAILIMIPANFSPSLLTETPPYWFRDFETIAAPLFVCISGYISSAYFTSSFAKNFKRTIYVLTAATLVEVIIWQSMPFITFDILFLIGFCIPLHFLFRKMNSKVTLIFTVLILCATPILQIVIGYEEKLTYSYDWSQIPTFAFFFRILKSFFIDGWFPFFPWAGISLLGRFLFLNREKQFQIQGTILTAIGVILTFIIPSNYFLRDGNSEMFYPPGIVFICTACGMLVLAFTNRKMFQQKFLHFFELFGRHSLLIYILHLAFASYLMHLIPWKGWMIFILITTVNYLLFFVLLIFYEKFFLKNAVAK